MHGKIFGVAGLAAAALLVTACSSSPSTPAATGATTGPAASTPAAGSGSSPASDAGSASASVDAATINGVQVLTNSKGFTLYWFVPDTSTASKCYGSCATYWPPVKGPVSAMSGVTGTLSTITRTDGTKQATYNGHPLYTYAADTAPGQANGNGINASGGVWHEVTVSGGAAPASSKVGGY